MIEPELPTTHGVESELFQVELEDLYVQFSDCRLKAATTRQVSGIAVRAIRDQKVGIASGAAGTDTGDLLARALDGSEVMPRRPLDLPIGNGVEMFGSYDAEIDRFTLEEMICLGRRVVDRVAARGEGLQVEVNILRSRRGKRVRNSRSLDRSHRRSGLWFSISLKRSREGDVCYVGDGRNRLLSEEELDEFVDGLLEEIELAGRIDSLAGGPTTVVVHPKALIQLLNPMLNGLVGRGLHEGTSPLVGRFGEEIVDPRLTLREDATWSRGNGEPIDDEGILPEPHVVIREGRLDSCFLNLEYAGRLGKKPTGNGHRDYWELARPPFTLAWNIRLDPGRTLYRDLLSNVREGLFLRDAWDIMVGCNANGDFSALVRLGYRISQGRLVGRIKDRRISGNIYQLLGEQLVDLSQERPEVSANSIQLPYALLRDVTVV